jgi:phosphopantetheinyl transferase (holo-ACP synthase)
MLSSYASTAPTGTAEPAVDGNKAEAKDEGMKTLMARNGRFCEISISHEDEYAVATALVYNEEFDAENAQTSPLG